jgi:hypothetical protein
MYASQTQTNRRTKRRATLATRRGAEGIRPKRGEGKLFKSRSISSPAVPQLEVERQPDRVLVDPRDPRTGDGQVHLIPSSCCIPDVQSSTHPHSPPVHTPRTPRTRPPAMRTQDVRDHDRTLEPSLRYAERRRPSASQIDRGGSTQLLAVARSLKKGRSSSR